MNEIIIDYRVGGLKEGDKIKLDLKLARSNSEVSVTEAEAAVFFTFV